MLAYVVVCVSRMFGVWRDNQADFFFPNRPKNTKNTKIGKNNILKNIGKKPIRLQKISGKKRYFLKKYLEKTDIEQKIAFPPFFSATVLTPL